MFLSLPIDPLDFNEVILTEALTLLPLSMSSEKARTMLTAIAIQESGLAHRVQIVSGGRRGPAKGLLQFEAGGGVTGVMTHRATAFYARTVCANRGVLFQRDDIHDALEYDDVLAACFARLLLWSDPFPLPANDDADGAWRLYVRTWRPGKPHREPWNARYMRAVSAVRSIAA